MAASQYIRRVGRKVEVAPATGRLLAEATATSDLIASVGIPARQERRGQRIQVKVRSVRFPRARTALAGAAAVVAGLGVVGVAHAGESGGPAPTAGAAGVGDTLFPGLGNGGYDAQSYDVSF